MHCARPLRFVLPLLTSLLVAPFAFAETWTDSTGKFSIEATFLSVSGGNVYLQKADGTRIKVPIDRLSKESFAQAKRLYEAAVAGGSATPAANDPLTPMPADTAASAGGSSGGSLGANPTAQQTADVLTAAIANADIETIWDALPAKYQSDVQDIVRTAANSIDAQTWNSVAGLLKKVSQLLNTKKQFFMNNAMIASSIPPDPSVDEIWDATAKVFDVYANSSITDQNQMKSFSMSDFIAKDFPAMKAAYQELMAVSKESPFAEMAEVPTIEVVSEDATEATVNVTVNGETKEERMLKVDNRWLPAEMVEEWDTTMASAKDGLAQLATPEGQQGMAQMRMGLMMASAPLDQLLAANDQASFDAVIENLSGMVMGLMGGMGGGPGGPGGGFPGGPGGGFPGGPGGGFPGGPDGGFPPGDAEGGFPGGDDAFPSDF